MVCFDFSALYPSIIIENNICFLTYYKSVEDALKNNFKVDDLNIIKDDNLNILGVFVKTEVSGSSLLPSSVSKLLDLRKKIKKEMKSKDVNSEEYSKLNNKQLAVKIVCNSFYGVLGASFGMLSAKKLAMCITSRGRYLLNFAKDTFFKICPNKSTWKIGSKSYNLKGELVYG